MKNNVKDITGEEIEKYITEIYKNIIIPDELSKIKKLIIIQTEDIFSVQLFFDDKIVLTGIGGLIIHLNSEVNYKDVTYNNQKVPEGNLKDF